MRRNREARLAVSLLCRMRQSDGWCDVRIRNISSRGLGATSMTPPATGQYVEVRRGSAVVVARVVWRQGCSFGLRSQDKIDLPSFAEQRVPAPAGQTQDKVERRSVPRKNDIAMAEQRSKRTASVLQFAAIAAAGLAAALVLSDAIVETFSVPIATASRALGGATTDRQRTPCATAPRSAARC